MKLNKMQVNNVTILKIETLKYKIELLDIGASIYKLFTKDNKGQFENIVLSLDDPQKYFDENASFLGCTIGRSAGRIANGEIIIKGIKYKLPKNSGNNNLHSSGSGTCLRRFNYKITKYQEKISVEYSILLKEKDDGFPGDINIFVTYELYEKHFKISFTSMSNKDTICNITNHSYFNLSGNKKRSILDHELHNTFSHIMLLNKNSIPCGKKNSEAFFTKRINSIGELEINNRKILSFQKGIDHPFVFTKNNKILYLYEEKSGRKLKVETTYPSVVLYTDNFSKTKLGIAVEPQYIPNEMNDVNSAQNTILKANVKSNETITYSFD